MNKAYVLYRVSFNNKHIVGVFNTREFAVSYATIFNVASWFVEESQFFEAVNV